MKFELVGWFVYPPQNCHVDNCTTSAFSEYRKIESDKTTSVLVCDNHEAEDTLQIGLDLED